MTFKTQLAADAANIFCNVDEFAEPVTYIAGGSGDGVSVSALVSEERAEYRQDGNRRTDVRRATVRVAESDAPTPSREDQFRFVSGDDGDIYLWRVEPGMGIEGPVDGMVVFHVVSAKAVQIAAEERRR